MFRKKIKKLTKDNENLFYSKEKIGKNTCDYKPVFQNCGTKTFESCVKENLQDIKCENKYENTQKENESTQERIIGAFSFVGRRTGKLSTGRTLRSRFIGKW